MNYDRYGLTGSARRRARLGSGRAERSLTSSSEELTTSTRKMEAPERLPQGRRRRGRASRTAEPLTS